MSDKRQTACEQGTMGLYLRDLRRVPQLNREEERAIAVLATQGDQKARQQLIQSNLRFVILVAKQYSNRGVPLEDLVNEGNIGLIRAAERFDPERGIRFVSYAVWWIRQAILQAIQENGRLIRLPKSPRSAYRHAEEQPTLSLDSPLPGMEDSDSLGARLQDLSLPKPEETLVGVSRQEHLDSALAGLSGREACILRDRFGLDGRKRITLQEAGRKNGLSMERVRQIEKKAIRKIRSSEGVRDLAVYAN